MNNSMLSGSILPELIKADRRWLLAARSLSGAISHPITAYIHALVS